MTCFACGVVLRTAHCIARAVVRVRGAGARFAPVLRYWVEAIKAKFLSAIYSNDLQLIYNYLIRALLSAGVIPVDPAEAGMLSRARMAESASGKRWRGSFCSSRWSQSLKGAGSSKRERMGAGISLRWRWASGTKSARPNGGDPLASS